MAYDTNQLQTSGDRNRVNTAMRATPQWRSAIQAMGLNPDGPLRLSGSQQQQLAQQLGIPTSDFHIDPAGNINDYHGWKGLPTWAKVAVIGGATVATMGAAGAFGGGAGAIGAGGGAGAGGAGATGGTLASTAIAPTATSLGFGAPTLAGAGTAAGGGGSLLGLAAKGKQIFDRFGQAADLFGGMAASRQANRQLQESNQFERDKQAMENAKSGLEMTGKRLDTAASASRLANWTPYKLDWSGAGSGRTPTGGYTSSGGHTAPPADDVRQLGALIAKQQLEAQGSPNQGVPTMTPPPRESALDKILGTAATGASFARLYRGR